VASARWWSPTRAGRNVKPMLPPSALCAHRLWKATLRAAAPHQKARRAAKPHRTVMLRRVICRAQPSCKRKAASLVIFPGGRQRFSMALQPHAAAAKGAP